MESNPNDNRRTGDPVAEHPLFGSPEAPRPPAEAGNVAVTGAIAQSILAALAMVGFLWIAKGLLIPVVLGICLAYLLATPVSLLQTRAGLPHGAAVVAILLAAVLGLGAAGWAVYGEAVKFGSKTSEYRERLTLLMDEVGAPIRALEKLTDNLMPGQDAAAPSVGPPSNDPLNPLSDGRPVNVRLVRERTELLPQLRSYVGGAAGMVEDISVTVFVAILALSGWKILRKKLLTLAGKTQYRLSLKILADIHEGLQGYLWGTFLVAVIVAVGTGVLLLAFGVPYALLWSLWAGLLAYVPYVGVPVAILPPMVLAYCNGSSFTEITVMAGLYLVFRTIEGQYITTLLLSSHVDMNPLAVLVSLLFWGWLWGPVGLIVAVPLTMTAIVLCDQLPGFAFVGELLGGEGHTAGAVIVRSDAPPPEAPAAPPSAGRIIN